MSSSHRSSISMVFELIFLLIRLISSSLFSYRVAAFNVCLLEIAEIFGEEFKVSYFWR